MRKAKKEEIRRLLMAVAGLCDRGSLDEVRRHVSLAIQNLVRIEEKELRKVREVGVQEKRPFNFPNPKLTLQKIDEMIGRELDKNSRPIEGRNTE